MKTALLVIATGEKYRPYINPFIKSAREYLFHHDVILWSDSSEYHPVKRQIYTPAKGYPIETLYRYHTFCQEGRLLSEYDFLLYSDVDMRFVAPVEIGDVFSLGITATEHPGYVGLNGTPEKRPESTAYCPVVRNYFCGGFNGGLATDFLQMCQVLEKNIGLDNLNNIKAVWNDESHLNRYLYDNPPARILSPSFCYPESEYRNPGGYYSAIWQAAGRGKIEPKLLALDKK